MEFPDSDQIEETTTLHSSRTRRPRSIPETISDHFKQNGGMWLIGIMTLLLVIVIPVLINLMVVLKEVLPPFGWRASPALIDGDFGGYGAPLACRGLLQDSEKEIDSQMPRIYY